MLSEVFHNNFSDREPMGGASPSERAGLCLPTIVKGNHDQDLFHPEMKVQRNEAA